MANPPAAANPLPSTHTFQVTVSKSMLAPRYQFTLPAKVAKDLQLNENKPAAFWINLSPNDQYWLEFIKQSHPGGGWRSNPVSDWDEIVYWHNVVEDELLTFTKVDYPGNCYVMRSPRLDEWNLSLGINPATMVVPPSPIPSYRVIVVTTDESSDDDN